MDRHRAGGKAIFINLYLFTALFFLALNFLCIRAGRETNTMLIFYAPMQTLSSR